MANYNKSFNFRNGVQVDEDNFLVNSFGLVGIGTTLPKTDLDVYGSVSVSNLITSKNLIVSGGIATFSEIRVGSAVTIIGSLGIVSAFRFYGDGSYLNGIPTSQWVDASSTKIYTTKSVVGIATNDPTRTLQIGGKTELGQKGVGITSEGDINASGIITASLGFYGSGQYLTSINASNLSSGTLNNSRLPNNINLTTGIATIATLSASNAVIGITTLNSNNLTTKEVVSMGFTGNKYYVKSSVDLSYGSKLNFESGSGISINGYTGSTNQFLISNGSGGIAWTKDISTSGVATVGLLSATDVVVIGVTTTNTINSKTGIITSLSSTNLTSFSADFTRIYSGLGTIAYLDLTNLYSSNGIGTIKTLRFTSGIGTNLTVVSFDSYGINAKEINCGLSTFTNLKSSYSLLGVTTTTSLTSSGINVVTGITTTQKITSGNIKINHAENKIETTSGDIILDPFDTIKLNKDVIAYYQTYFTGISTIATGLLPDTNLGAYLGSSSLAFQHLYVGDVILSAVTSNKIDTKSLDLNLNSKTEKVFVEKDLSVDRNLSINGISTFTSLVNINTGLLPDTNLGAYLGSSSLAFQHLYVGDVILSAVTSNKIDTKSLDLNLNSKTEKVFVEKDLSVDRNLSITGISTFTSLVNINTGLLPDVGLGAYLGSSEKPFGSAYIGDINLGIGYSNLITTISDSLDLNSKTEKVFVKKDLSVDRNLSITGISTFTSLVNINTGIIPSTNAVYLGTESSPFSELYVDNIKIGVGETDLITTKIGKLKLNSFQNIVNVEKDLSVDRNLSITGISTFTSLVNINTGLLPDVGLGAYLGSSEKPFGSTYIGDIQIGIADSTSITTRSGGLSISPITGFTTIAGKLYVNTLEVETSSLLKGNIYFGENSQVTIDAINTRVGIGTTIPTSELQIIKQSDCLLEVISNTGISRISIGQTVGVGKSTGTLQYNTKNVELSNNDTGNLDFYIHRGAPGISTGNFRWFYGQNNNQKLTLTYEGKLGIGKTNPNETFEVVGTSTVTQNAHFGNDIYVKNDIYFKTLKSGTVATNTSVTTGTSNFSTIYLYGGSNVLGIGTNIGGGYKFKIENNNPAYLGNNVAIGITNVNDLADTSQSLLKVFGNSYLRSANIGTSVSINSGIVTANKGFTSGIGTAVVIYVIDNTIQFHVGTAFTSLKLY